MASNGFFSTTAVRILLGVLDGIPASWNASTNDFDIALLSCPSVRFSGSFARVLIRLMNVPAVPVS